MRISNPQNLKNEVISGRKVLDPRRRYIAGQGYVQCDVVSRKFIANRVFQSVFHCPVSVAGVYNDQSNLVAVAPVSAFTVYKDPDTGASSVSYQAVAGTGFWQVTTSKEFWVLTNSPVINLAQACRGLMAVHGVQFDEQNLTMVEAYLNSRGYTFVGSIPLTDTLKYLQEIAWEHGLRAGYDGAIKFEPLVGSVVNLLHSDNFKIDKLIQTEVERKNETWQFECPVLTHAQGGSLIIKSTQSRTQIEEVVRIRNNRKGVKYQLDGWMDLELADSNTEYLCAIKEILLPGEYAGTYYAGKNKAVLGYQRFLSGVAQDNLEGVAVGDLVEVEARLLQVIAINPTTLNQAFDGVGVVLDNTPLPSATPLGHSFAILNGVIVTNLPDGGNFAYLVSRVSLSLEQSRSQQDSSRLVKVTLYET